MIEPNRIVYDTVHTFIVKLHTCYNALEYKSVFSGRMSLKNTIPVN